MEVDYSKFDTPAQKRKKDCPAASVCEQIGTTENGCFAGSDLTFATNGHCQASIVLLLSRLSPDTTARH